MEDTVNLLARHVARTRYETLPPRVIELTKLFILDTLGTMMAGSAAPGCKEVVGLVKEWGGKPDSAIAVFGGAVPAPEAALANTMMAHALDLDDLHDEAVVHCSCCQVSTGLAVGQSAGRGGKDLITAVAVGIDLASRLGVAIGPAMGFVRSGTCNIFGAAANTAKLLGLDEEQTRHALGICLSQTAGNTQVVIDGALVKRMQPGFAARGGILSAFLARAGIKGPVGVMDGKFGFFELYKRGPTLYNRLTDRLSEFFEIENVSIKLFCGGRYIHGPAEATVDIATKEGITAADVAKITVSVPKMTYDYVGRPFVPGDSPQVNAQFSAAYAAAAGVVYHDLFIDQVQESAILNPEVLDLAQKRTVVVIDESVTEPAATLPVSVEVETQDGRKFFRKIELLKGQPGNFVPNQAFIDKFRKTAKWAAKPIPEENIEKLIDLTQHLEELHDVGVLMKLAQPAVV
ncbi:MAG: MmgE/PrpD family protein [Chloroflexota bacterium]